MKKIIFTLLCIPLFAYASAQVNDTVKISRSGAEAAFLERNIDLMVRKLEISQAEARVLQAKYWPNPTLTVDEVNLWRTYDIEEQPALTGNWGKSSQVSVQVEQVIKTAGKRRKNIELRKIEVDGEKYEWQEVLRELKKMLRNTMTELAYNQELQRLYASQISSITKLTASYKNQLTSGNISKAEYIRLKAQEVEFRKKQVSLQQEAEEQQTELKALLMLPADRYVMITDPLKLPQGNFSELDLTQWMAESAENRPDILLSRNQQKQALKNLELQNALKTPDLTFSVGYDRGGNIMKDFIGVGVSLDLPVFDRNKGNIQDARIEVDKTGYETRKNIVKSQNEISSVYQNYLRTKKISAEMDDDYESTLDSLLVSHEKNFRLRNISMLEYMDFLETYIDNKTIILETKKELNGYFENLQYVVGKDL